MIEEEKIEIDTDGVFDKDPEPTIEETIEQLPQPLQEIMRAAHKILGEPSGIYMSRLQRREQRAIHFLLNEPETYLEKLNSLLRAGWYISQTIPAFQSSDVVMILSKDEEGEGEGNNDRSTRDKRETHT